MGSSSRIPRIAKTEGPVLVCILDGFGFNKEDQYNAVYVAETPVYDSLRAKAPERFRWAVCLTLEGPVAEAPIGPGPAYWLLIFL